MNNSKYYQIKNLYPSLKNPQKYVGKDKIITTRSSWETKYILKFLDIHPSVLEWSSEDRIIPYIKPTDGKVHRYFLDFWMKLKTKDGIKEYLVEVKPQIQVDLPKKPIRITKGYIDKVTTYMINQAKWKATKEYCISENKKGKDISFIIETENTVGGLFK